MIIPETRHLLKTNWHGHFFCFLKTRNSWKKYDECSLLERLPSTWIKYWTPNFICSFINFVWKGFQLLPKCKMLPYVSSRKALADSQDLYLESLSIKTVLSYLFKMSYTVKYDTCLWTGTEDVSNWLWVRVGYGLSALLICWIIYLYTWGLWL